MAGEYPSCLTDLQSAAELGRRLDDAKVEIQALVWIATFQGAHGDFEAAVESYRRTYPLLEARDRLGRWWIDFSVALLLAQNGRLDEAIARYESIIESLPLLEDPENFLHDWWIANLLEFGTESTRHAPHGPQQAEQPHRRVRILAEILTRTLWGHALHLAKRKEEALEQMNLAIAASRRVDGFFSTTLLGMLAELRIDNQDPGGAADAIQEALAQDFDTPIGEQARMLISLAITQRWAGRLDAAHTTLREALQLAAASEDASALADVHRALGVFYLATRRFETSANHLERALELYEDVDSPHRTRCRILLDSVYQSLEVETELTESMPPLESAIDRLMLETIGLTRKVDRETGTLDSETLEDLRRAIEQSDLSDLPRNPLPGLLELIEAMNGIGRQGEVDELLAVAIRSENPLVHYYGLLLSALQNVLHGQPAQARAEVDELLKEIQGRRRWQVESMVHFFLAEIHWQDRRPEEALAALRQAVEAQEAMAADMTIEELSTSSGSSSAWLYREAVALHARTGETATAFHLAERARAQTLLRLSANSAFRPTVHAEHGPVGDFLRAEIQDLETRARDAEGDERRRLLDELHQARRRLQHYTIRGKVRRPRPEEGGGPAPVALELDEVRSLLDPHTTLVSYFVTGPQVLRWIVDSEGTEFQALDLDADTLEAWIGCWLRSLAGDRGRVPLEVPTRGDRGVELLSLEPCETGDGVAGALYAALLQGLDARPSRRRLLVAPHGVLHALPFAALRDPVTRRHLVEDVAVVHLPSASMLGALTVHRVDPTGPPVTVPAPDRSGVLVVGDPAGYLPPLPGAEREAAEVARLFGTTALVGARANEDTVRARLGGSRLVHLATHGVFDRRSPRFSRLVLADGARHDGALEVHEILALPELAGVELAVLSGCQTALGEITGGDDVIGLGRAFLHAGVRSVVSTLWPIADEASARLMVDFHRRVQAGDAPADALRQAQLARLRDPATRAPYYWAAFTVWGDPGRDRPGERP